MSETTKQWARYIERVDAVIAYIHDHLSEPLTSDKLAEVAHLSPYHWHRIYRAITGESAVATVKRSRLHQAAAELIRTDLAVEAVGALIGYPELHSFNRTFKAYYGVAPGQFRKANKPPADNDSPHPVFDPDLYPVAVEQRPDMHLIGLWHEGDFMNIGQTFGVAMAQCTMHGLMPEAPITAGVYFHDPEVTGEDDLRSFAGVCIDPLKQAPGGLQKIVHPGGKFAVMTHQGPYALLNQSYHWLFGCWLPASGKSVRDQPCCEIYLNTPIDTEPADLLTAICLPID